MSQGLKLYVRAAWAHDFDNEGIATAFFQSLPGTTFQINSAKPARDGALTAVGFEYKLRDGWSVLGKFDGEFSQTTAIFAGTGTLLVSRRIGSNMSFSTTNQLHKKLLERSGRRRVRLAFERLGRTSLRSTVSAKQCRLRASGSKPHSDALLCCNFERGICGSCAFSRTNFGIAERGDILPFPSRSKVARQPAPRHETESLR
jgi:Autotransporter beta-domain